jgi:hypothetical protein
LCLLVSLCRSSAEGKRHADPLSSSVTATVDLVSIDTSNAGRDTHCARPTRCPTVSPGASDLELAVLPGPVLAALSQRLEATARANERMAEHYRAQKSRFAVDSPAAALPLVS